MRRQTIFDFTVFNLLPVLLFFSFVFVYFWVIKEDEQIRKNEQKKQNFPVWKTIRREVFKNTDEIRKALKSRSNDFNIEYWANDILDKMPLGFGINFWIYNMLERSLAEHKMTELDLVLVSAAQLGFNNHVPYQDIRKRAQELGLKPPPAEAGPQLRLQYKDQPENEWLHIAMEPIIASDGDPTVFDIMHYDHPVHENNKPFAHGDHYGLQLCSSSVRSDVLWSPFSLWVFAAN